MKIPSSRLVVFIILWATIFWASVDVSAETASTTRHIFVGYSSKTLNDIDHKDAKTAIKVWSDVLSKDMGDNIVQETEIFNDLASLIEAFKKRQIRMIAVTPMQFLEARKIIELDPIFTSIIGENPLDRLLLLVRTDSGFKSLSDLRGKNLIIESYLIGEIADMWLEVALSKAGLPPAKQFFTSVKSTAKPNKAVTPVFFKQADACLVREAGFKAMNEMNPQISKQLTPIGSSDPYLLGVVAFAKDYDPDLKKSQMKSAVRLHTFPKGQQILTLFKIDKIVDFKDEYLTSTLELANEFEKLRSKKP